MRRDHSLPVFRAGYAAIRLDGVAAMFRDATCEEEIGNALMHLDTVFNQTVREAATCGIYHR